MLAYKSQSIYDLVQEKCGDVVVEAMRLQDVSLAECLFEVCNIFAFLSLGSNKFTQIKKKAGIFLNNGSYILKTRLLYRVQTFINNPNDLNGKRNDYPECRSLSNSHTKTILKDLIEKLPSI